MGKKWFHSSERALWHRNREGWLEPFAWNLFLFQFEWCLSVFNNVSIKAHSWLPEWKHPIEIYVQEERRINNKILLYSTENIQYPVINHKGKYKRMYMCVCVCVLCVCVAGSIDTTLYYKSTTLQFKKRMRWSWAAGKEETVREWEERLKSKWKWDSG